MCLMVELAAVQSQLLVGPQSGGIRPEPQTRKQDTEAAGGNDQRQASPQQGQ